MFATFEEEAFPEQIPVLGADRCMWASDYPHTDSTFPESRRVIDETLGRPDTRGPAQGHGAPTAPSCTTWRSRLSPQPGAVLGFDHVSLPMRDADAMVAFYRALGLDVVETPYLVQVHLGDQMINFHRAEMWQRADFTLRAPAADPPCGDLCFVWGGIGRRIARRAPRRGRARSSKVRFRAAARAAWRRRACTCATLTATSWNS